MSLTDFMRNRAPRRANPTSTPRENALTILDAQAQIETRAPFVSVHADPARAERLAQIEALAAERVPLDELWERCHLAGLVPDAWVDGSAHFAGGLLRLESTTTLPTGSWCWCREGAVERPASFDGLLALGVAGRDAGTIEALWREAVARLRPFQPELLAADPVWAWEDWYNAGPASRIPTAHTWLRGARLGDHLAALNQEVNAAGGVLLTLGREVASTALAALASRRANLPWLPTWRARRTQQILPVGYDRALVAAIVWELAAALDLKVSGRAGVKSPLAGQPFSTLKNPYLPLVEILRRGYGWARVALAQQPGTRSNKATCCMALIAPRLRPLHVDLLTVQEWLIPREETP